MNELTEFMSPQEAWDELLSERNTYIRRHKAAYSGLHMELTATAFQDSFWNRHGKAKIHVPLAADMAAVSSDLLFGNAPRCKIYDDNREAEENDKQNRLDQILRGSKFESLLQEAAETAAVIGDIYLKCNWDSKALPCPSICYVSGEDAVPEYRFAKLVCVHFFTIIKQHGPDLAAVRALRARPHLEHGLYRRHGNAWRGNAFRPGGLRCGRARRRSGRRDAGGSYRQYETQPR